MGIDCSGSAVHIATKRLLEVDNVDAPAVRVERVVEPDRSARFEARVREHLGIEPDGQGAKGGTLDGVPVVIAGYDEAVTNERVEAWAQRASAAVIIVGRQFDLPLRRSEVEGVDVTLLRVSEDLWNDAVVAARGAAVHELPTVGLDVMREGESWSLVLDDYAVPHPQRLDPGLLEAVQDPLDFVDAWSITWNVSPLLALQTDVAYARSHQRRALPTRSEPQPIPSAPQSIRVRIVDVLFQHSTISAVVMPCPEAGIRLEDVRLR